MLSAFMAASLLSLAVATGNGPSEDKPYQLPDTITVTAERFAASTRNASWPVRTLLLHRAVHFQDLSEALDGIAGIDVTGYGQTGHLSNLFIWGAPSSQVLLLKDGRPVINPATGGFNLAEFSSAELERVEVVKGTQSSLYGSDAIGGVVNLITRKPYSRQYGGGFAYGNNDFVNYNLRMTQALSDWHLDLLHEGTIGDNGRPNSGIRRNIMEGKLLYSPERQNWESFVSYRYFRDSVGLPGPVPDQSAIPYYGVADANSTVNHQQDFIHSWDATFRLHPKPEAAFSADLNIFYEKRILEYFGKYAYLGFANDSIDVNDRNRNVGRNSGIEGRVRSHFGELVISGGLEFLSGSSRVDNRTVATTYDLADTSSSILETALSRRHHRDIYALWTSQSIALADKLRVDLSERLQLVNGNDTYEAFNSGLKFFPSDDWSVSIAFGSAFRLPAFNDLYWPQDEYSVGNPNLIPEKGNNISLSLTALPNRKISLNSGIFYRRVKDLISWAPLGEDNSFGSPRWTPSNLNRFRSFGADFGLKYLPADRWEIEAELTAQSARQKNKELVYSGADGTQRFETVERDASFVPAFKARAALKAELDFFSGQVEAVFTSERKAYFAEYSYDSQFNALISYKEKKLASSVLLNIGVSRPIGEIIDISLNINDIFDEKPARQFGGSLTDGDYPSLGRNFIASINFRIK